MGVAPQTLLHLQRQRVHPPAHVRYPRGQPHPHSTGNRNHRRPTTASTRASAGACTVASTTTVVSRFLPWEVEARLHYLIELKGIGLLTGEVGSGKTTVCRHVAAALHPGLHRVGYVSLTTGNVLDMYIAIAWELGLPTERSRATAFRAIRAETTRLVCEAKQLPVLVIDEAQHLRNDVLEDLRLLN